MPHFSFPGDFHQLSQENGNRIKYLKVDAESGDEEASEDIIKGNEVDDLQSHRFRLRACTIETASSSSVFALGVNLMDALRQSAEAGGKRTKAAAHHRPQSLTCVLIPISRWTGLVFSPFMPREN